MQSGLSPFYLFRPPPGSFFQICSILGCNGGKISKKTCFVEEVVLVKRMEIDFI